jgi:hypothetical protein
MYSKAKTVNVCLGMTILMHYFRFEEYSNRLELLLNTLKLRAVVSNPRRSTFFSFFLFTLFMYLSYPYWGEKGFNVNYLIEIGIYWANNAQFNNKNGT